MQQFSKIEADKSMRFDGTDLEIKATLEDETVTINIMKSGSCIHRLTINDAVGTMEHSWIADLFARDDHIELSQIARDADDYISQLNINQG